MIDRLNASVDRALAAADASERAERPERLALADHARATPRLVYREQFNGGTPTYRTIRLANLRWVPAHTEEFQYLGESRKHKRKVPDRVRVLGAGHIRDVAPDSAGDYVRRPSARALARIEAAEEAIRTATAELKAARRAAFTHGKPVPVSAVKRVTRERDKLRVNS